MKYVASVHLSVNGTEYEVAVDDRDPNQTAALLRDRLQRMAEGRGAAMALVPVRATNSDGWREVLVVSTEAARAARVFARMHHAVLAA